MIKKIQLPLEEPANLQVGDKIQLYGKLCTGRDAALPTLELAGSAFMHTAVSEAGISPTTSNKVEIEGSMAYLSGCGVKMHIGKGSLSPETVDALSRFGSVFVVTPPAAALLSSRVISNKVVAFPEEGMEAIHELEVDGIPGIVASAQGETIN